MSHSDVSNSTVNAELFRAPLAQYEYESGMTSFPSSSSTAAFTIMLRRC